MYRHGRQLLDLQMKDYSAAPTHIQPGLLLTVFDQRMYAPRAAHLKGHADGWLLNFDGWQGIRVLPLADCFTNLWRKKRAVGQHGTIMRYVSDVWLCNFAYKHLVTESSKYVRLNLR
eukprot:GHUV01037398.1.p2 GENE.GHUV01037398.1~~GHUV01037398.1.p2  ORF type:complete len:117 (+),score=13.14 GHUV01037398.1:446-796(+)